MPADREQPVQRADTLARPTLFGYLDQWVYVELAKAFADNASSDLRARDALLAARLDGHAAFPLSWVHYLETWKTKQDHRRRDLAAEMFRLSGFRAIAPAQALWRVEIRNAVRATFRRSDPPEPVQPFGFGAAHAHGRPLLDGELTPYGSERWVRQELALLSGPNPSEFAAEERQRRTDDQAFAVAEAAFSKTLATWRTTPRDREQRFRIHALTLFDRDFAGALIGAEVTREEYEALGPDGWEGLVAAVPTIWTLTELRRVRTADPNAPFKPTDLNDLRALAMALVYCDVVVPDKAWADMVRRTDLAVRFGTTICRTITDAADAFRAAT